MLTTSRPDPDTWVSTQRSVLGPTPTGTVAAFVYSPSGDVLRRVDGWLVWDHIITSPGGSVFPFGLDRALTNLLRRLRLNGAELRTYRREAEGWRAWMTSSISRERSSE
jgi:hypothetical protein